MKVGKTKQVKKKRVKKKFVNDVPGTPIYTGEKNQHSVDFEVIDYDKDSYNTYKTNKVEAVFNKLNSGKITWINVNGLNHIDKIEKLGEHYNLHPLIIEDIVDTDQRPKIDEYPDYLFIVFKMLYHREDGSFVNEHISLVLGPDYVFTFQEADGDVFDSLRKRLENSKGRVRNAGADYLTFAIMDAVVDHYFNIIESLSEKIEKLEDTLFLNKQEIDITHEIQALKREVLQVRRSVYPFREVINRLEKIDTQLIDEKTVTYIRDLYDHIIQVTESVDIYREMIWSLMDMYMSTISNKMNEIMKLLTIISTIFIPLTFLAGIYGMNFKFMPELNFKYGYFLVWAIMILVFLGLLYYFKRKKWL